MSATEIWETAGAVITSVGGGGAIVAVFSSRLGKLWADKLMVKEKAKHDKELTEFKLELEQTNQKKLTELQSELEIYRETYLKAHSDKIAIYRLAADVISEFLADFYMIRAGQKPQKDISVVLHRFERDRLKAHGYLAMLAPQQVMDAYDSLIDFICSSMEKNPPNPSYEDWKETRQLSYNVINAIREDIGIDKNKIEYRGKR